MWQFATTTPPRAVGFLPNGSSAGTPLCLGADGEMHALSSAPSSTAATPTNANGVGRTSLRLGGPSSKFEAIFGAAPIPDQQAEEEERAAAAAAGVISKTNRNDAWSIGAGPDGDDDGGAAAAANGGEGGAGALKDGWEARAVDGWLSKSVSSVPSHLLPPLQSLAPSMMHSLMRAAPHAAGNAPGGGAKPKADVQREAERQAKALGREDDLKEAVAQWAPLLRRGFLGATKPMGAKRKERGGGADADGGASGAARPSREAEAEAGAWVEAQEAVEARGAEVVLRGGGGEPAAAAPKAKAKAKAAAQAGGSGLRRGFLCAPSSAAPAKVARRAADDAAEAAATAGTTAASAAAALSAAAAAAGSGEAWPPRGWRAMDLCGVPNPGYIVRDTQLPPALWDGSGAPPASLSAEDRAFWRGNAYSAAELLEVQQWLSEAQQAAEGDEEAATAPPPPDALSFEPLDATPDQVWQASLDGGAFRGVCLADSDGRDLESELREARAALAAASIGADTARGVGVLQGELPEAMCQPRKAGWQLEPTKGELKQLAKLYEQRRQAGEPAERLSVLAAGLRASNCRAARRAVQEADANGGGN